MRFERSLVPLLVIAVALSLMSWSRADAKAQQAGSRWTVTGRKLAWTMQAPSSWIGGSYEQIQQVRDTMKDEGIKTLLGQIWFSARQVDAYLVHTDVSGITTKTPSSINIDVSERGFAATSFNDEMWRAYATLDEDNSKGGTTVFMQADTLKVGGRTAPRGMFKTTLRSGGTLYKVQCIVLLDAQRSHVFKFQADQAKALAHMKDFDEMLFSVRYK